MSRYFVLFVAMLAMPGLAKADILLNETFSYANGDLTSVSGGLWANHSGTGNFIQVLSGAAVLEQGAGSREDANRSLGATMAAGNIWRFEFDVVVNGVDPAQNVYFAHFKDAGTGFNARAFVAAPVAGGNFTFGISDVGSAPDVTFATDFTYGVSYRVFSEYNFDTGISTLWINDPSTQISSITADAGQAMTSFALRQAGGNTTMTIDNVVVTAIPEPASAMLLGLGLIGLIGYRRR